MKAIELVQINATRQQVREITVLGYIDYQPEKTPSWVGVHADTLKRFNTKSEAVRFASTGEA